MRILLLPFGSAGDVHPFVGLGLELRRCGHDVMMAANGYFRPLIESNGFELIEQGTRQEFLAACAHPDLWHPTKAFGHLYHSGIRHAMRAQWSLIESLTPHDELVVVSNCLGFGARCAQEKFGVDLVTVHLQPACLWSDFESPAFPGVPKWPRFLKRWLYRLGERIAIEGPVMGDFGAFRREHGLPPVKRLSDWWHSPSRVICLFPEWFSPRQPDWPAAVRFADFPLWDDGTDRPLDPELEEFLANGAPPIVLTPGTGNMLAKPFFTEAVAGCIAIGRRALVVTRFEDQVPRPLPDGIMHVAYAPFTRLLPRSAAIIHHGGIGTTAQSLRAGVPQLILPMAHDQPDNVARVTRLGCGVGLSRRRFRRDRIAEDLTRLLGSDSVARATADIARRLEKGDGLALAAAVIEDSPVRTRHRGTDRPSGVAGARG